MSGSAYRDLIDSKRPCRNRVRGMGSHQSSHSCTDEWFTPPEIIRALGPFDLDPCAPVVRPWPTACQHFTIKEDGLTQPWHGRVWLNPPYGKQTDKWLRRLCAHGNGIALVFARTETSAWFNDIWGIAQAVLFIRGRLHFYDINGKKACSNAGAPSALVAYGESNATTLITSGIPGRVVRS